MTDSDRIELADQRVRIGTLEAMVDRQGEVIERLAAALANVLHEEDQRGRLMERRYRPIRALAGFFAAGNIEAAARLIERACSLEMPPPGGAERYVEQLRREYGRGGPSRPTIRRALSEFSRACENVAATAD